MLGYAYAYAVDGRTEFMHERNGVVGWIVGNEKITGDRCEKLGFLSALKIVDVPFPRLD